MGRRRERLESSASSSSSEFEFTVSDQSSRKSSITLCPADDLFYKGQLLPLHLSPRLSMVRTLFLASSSSSTSSSSDVTAAVSRHSTDSTSSLSGDLVLLPDCDNSRPTSVTDQDKTRTRKNNEHYSFSRFSSFFRNEFTKTLWPGNVKRIGFDAAEVIKKYLKKVKHVKTGPSPSPPSSPSWGKTSMAMPVNRGRVSHSFSGNLRYPRKSSRPPSTPSSPSHSGILSGAEFYGMYPTGRTSEGISYADRSSTEELQSAIQGAIAHCKNSMIQKQPAGSDYENSKF